MVKLTKELIEKSLQHTNAVLEREISFRGYKIPIIENLGATLDQFDVIDFSDNDIRKLDGFPLLKRIRTLLCNNNRICRVADNLEVSLPNLEWLVLTNNNIVELGDLDALQTIPKLRHLSLLRNPVTAKKHYRYYLIWRLPHLDRLDFRRIRQREREAAAQLFRGKKGKQFATTIGKKSKLAQTPAVQRIAEAKARAAATMPKDTSTAMNGVEEEEGPMPGVSGRSAEDQALIAKAISEAKSLQEVERLKAMLASGQIPGKVKKVAAPQDSEEIEETEEDDEMNGGGAEQEEALAVTEAAA